MAMKDRPSCRTVEGRGKTCFAANALERLEILRELMGEEFERDEADEFGVFRLVNNTHPTPAEFFEDAVVGNGLSKQ
jgi:hypothetical protein